jgi:glycosyltransferase involved in cell wall biosynthesis
MNIVFVAPFAYQPKATISARMLPIAAALVERGHQVTILIPPYDYPDDSGKRWQSHGVTLENMTLGRLPSALSYYDLARQLRHRLGELRPELIHYFKPVGPGALAMWLARGDALAPSLIDNDDWEGTGGWVDVNPYSRIQKRVMIWQERWCLRHARAVTCASEALMDRTADFRGVRDRLLLLPNGPLDELHSWVNEAQARRDALRAQFGWSDQRVIIYGGNIPHGNDMDIAIRAVVQAHAHTPNLRWCVVASGEGLDQFKERVSQSQIAPLVEWHTFMPHQQLIARTVAADIAIYPYRDTPINRAKCSGKIMDYMACAKPIVTSDVGMNRVYLQNQISAMLTVAGDADAFAGALQWLLSHSTEADAMGRAAQQRLWQHFGWRARIGELEHLYYDVARV